MTVITGDLSDKNRILGIELLINIFQKKNKLNISEDIFLEIKRLYNRRFEGIDHYISFLKYCCDVGHLDIVYIVTQMVDKDSSKYINYQQKNNQIARIVSFLDDPNVKMLQGLMVSGNTSATSLMIKKEFTGYFAKLNQKEATHYENMILNLFLVLICNTKEKLLSSEECIHLFSHFHEAKYCCQLRKDTVFLLLIDYCLSFDIKYFFQLPNKFYNHTQQVLDRLVSNKIMKDDRKKELVVSYLNALGNCNNLRTGKKIRVAVCISGLYRNHKASLTSIMDNLVHPLDADVFVHTWDEQSLWAGFGGSPHSKRIFGNAVGDVLDTKYQWLTALKPIIPNTYDILSKPISISFDNKLFNEILRPKKILVENETDFIATLSNANNFTKLRGSLNQLKMFYGMKKVFELALAEHKYDYIIRIRPDVSISHKFTLKQFDDFQNNILYGSTNVVGLADTFFVISSSMAYNFSRFVDLMKEKQELSPFDEFPLYDSHNLLLMWLISNNYTYDGISITPNVQMNTPVKITGLMEAVEKDKINLDDDTRKEFSKFITFLEENYC